MLHAAFALFEDGAGLEANHIDGMAFRKQRIHCLDLFFTAVLRAPCAEAVGHAVGVQHGHDLILAAGGLRVTARGDVEEGLFLQRLEDGNVPLAGALCRACLRQWNSPAAVGQSGSPLSPPVQKPTSRH